MGAGLFLAGVAGAAVVYRRKGERDLPPEPVEAPEHAEFRRILEQSAAYNDTLFEMMQHLADCSSLAEYSGLVAEMTSRNHAGLEKINAMREVLRTRLEAQGRTFADVEGYTELISEYRSITLEQQRRHLEVYQRVQRMQGMPASSELLAYIKLGFKDDEQRYADTERQLMKAAEAQRELMLRAGRVMSGVTGTESAAAAPEELNALGASYMEQSARIRLYRDDDPAGATSAVAELRSLYAALLPMLQQHARRLREADFYGNEPLREVVERMLPEEKQS